MVEAAFVMGVVLILIGGAIDFGIAFHRYTLLADSVSEVARQVSAKQNLPCDELASQAASELQIKVAQLEIPGVTLNPDPPNYGNIDVASSASLAPMINLRVSWEMRCFFCNAMPNRQIDLSTLILLENVGSC